MLRIDGCASMASTANNDAFIEPIRTRAPSVNGTQWRTTARLRLSSASSPTREVCAYEH